MTIHDTMPATQPETKLAQFVRSVYRLTAGAVLERQAAHAVALYGHLLSYHRGVRDEPLETEI